MRNEVEREARLAEIAFWILLVAFLTFVGGIYTLILTGHLRWV